MSLRRKLLAAFAGLLAVAMLVAGAALFATLRWQATAADMETHYQRSLLLQQVRAGTFQALKEVDDALTGDHVDARADFERALAPARRDFEEWAALADTHAEQGEVARVRGAHQRLIGNALQVFALIPRDRDAALRMADDEVDTGDYERFRMVTERAVQADQERRRAIRAITDRVRTTTQIMLGVSVLSILSLALLIAAYLSQDLFAPLRNLSATAHRLSLGDVKARADEDRDDEIGEVGRALNRLADSIDRRSVPPEAASAGEDWNGHPGGATLRSLVARLQSHVRALKQHPGMEGDKRLAKIDNLAEAMSRLGEPSLSRDLELGPVDLAALVHGIVSGHRMDLAERAVSLELSLDAEIEPVLADRLKLREALNEAMRNALDALPPKGGRLGFRTYRADGAVRIEVADSGCGMSGDLVEQALGKRIGESVGGLARARSIAEQHGGTFAVFSDPGKGTVAQFTLPNWR